MNELLVERLKTARTDKGLKQQDVAEQLGIKANTISNWEKGRTEPDIDTFVKLCDIYEIDCASLLSDVYAFKRISKDITLAEYNHIKKYRDLNEHGKEMVNFTLEKEWEHSKALKGKEEKKDNIVEFEAHILPKASSPRTDIDVTTEQIEDDDNTMENPEGWES